MRFLRGVTVAALGSVLAVGCGQQSTDVVLRLGHGLDPTHPVHRAMERMAEIAEERSRGELRIELYPSEQLGSERECLELLQIGSLDLAKVSASVLENFAPAFRVLGVPYLFRSEEELYRVLDGEIGQQLLLEPVAARLRGLCFYDAGSRSFYTRSRRVTTPGDLQGLKIRTQESSTAMSMVAALGGSPTPIAWGELYTALQQGVVDGAENNPPSFHLSGHYQVCRYYTLDEHTAVPDVLLVATRTWERLAPEHQGILADAAVESAVLQRELWRQATAEALEAVAAAGVEILRPDKGPFAAQMEPLLERLAGDPTLGTWIARIRAAASREALGD